MNASLRCPDGHLTQSTDYCDVCGLPLSLSARRPDGAGSGAAAGPGAGSWPGYGSGNGAGAGRGGAQAPSPSSQSSPPPEQDCPNCGYIGPATDLFCENCGYDFTTGQLPVDPAAMLPERSSRLPPILARSLDQPSQPDPIRPSRPRVVQPDPRPGPTGQAVPLVRGPAPRGLGPAPDSQPWVDPSQAGHSQLVWVAELWVDPDWFATQEGDESCPSSGMPIIVPLWDRSLLIGRASVSRNIHPQIDCGTDHGVSRRHAQLTSDGRRWWIEDLQSSNGTFVGPAGAPLPTVPIRPGQRTEFAAGDRIYVGAWSRIVVRRATPDEA